VQARRLPVPGHRLLDRDPGAAVVQTGTTIVDGAYLPDVDDDVAEVAGWFAPVTGSVGPMTRAMLLTNCVVAAERRARR